MLVKVKKKRKKCTWARDWVSQASFAFLCRLLPLPLTCLEPQLLMLVPLLMVVPLPLLVALLVIIVADWRLVWR